MPFTSNVVTAPIVRWAFYLRSRPLLAYAIAVLSVLFATALRWSIGPETGVPFLTYFPMITIVGLLCGVGAGALASLLSGVMGVTLFAPTYAWGGANPFAMALVVFMALCGLKLVVIGLLHQALDELFEQERNIRQLVEAVPAGIVVAANDGTIRLFNRWAQELFGYGAEIIGKPVDQLVPEKLRSTHEQNRQYFMSNPLERPMGKGIDLSCLRKNGTTFEAEIGLSPLVRGGRTSVVATVVDISERRKALERERFLMREVHHRGQNMLAVIQSIVRTTLDGHLNLNEARELLSSRILALANAQKLLLANVWEGADLRQIIEAGVGALTSKVAVSGCDLVVNRDAAQQFVLIFHELATNALKHGALSSPNGTVLIEGRMDRQKDAFEVSWREEGGPPVFEPARRGFGSTILVRAAKQFAEDVTIEYSPAGLRYSLRIPMARLREARSEGDVASPLETE